MGARRARPDPIPDGRSPLISRRSYRGNGRLTAVTTSTAPTLEPSSGLEPPTRRTRRLTALAYVGLVLALVYAGATMAGGVSDAFDQIRHVSLWWVAPAVALRFLLLGAQLRRLRGPWATSSWHLGTPIALIAFGLGAVMPAAPAEGFTLAVVELRRRSMPARAVWLMLATSQWMQFWALVIVFAVDRVVVAAAGQIHHRHPARMVLGSVVLLALCAGAFWIIRRPSTGRRLSALTRVLSKQRKKSSGERAADAAILHGEIGHTLGSRRNRLAVTAVSVGATVADAAAIFFMLRSVHADITFEIAIIVYVAAMVVAWVPLLPSGIGLTEVAIPALLHHFGVPLATGLAAVLLWRAVALALPALAGLTAWLTVKAAPLPAAISHA
jgi:conserved hypothetical protein